jgi:hypothetical protein
MNKIGRKNKKLNFEFGSSNFFCEDGEIKFKTSFLAIFIPILGASGGGRT